MNALDSIAEKHPVGTGLTGFLGSVLAWLLANADVLNSIGRLMLIGLGVLNATLTALLLIRRSMAQRYYIRRMSARELNREDELP